VFVLMVAGGIISALAGHGHGHGSHAWVEGAPLFWLVWVVLGWRFFARRRGGVR
jgi:hypothetical protein